jgi:hypothetical protein
MPNVYQKLVNIEPKNYEKTIIEIYNQMRVGFFNDGDSTVINELLANRLIEKE